MNTAVRVVALFCMVACFATGQAAASTLQPYGVTLFGGMAPPTGTLGDFTNPGLSFGGSFNYQTSDRLVIEVVAANGQMFGIDTEGLGLPSDVEFDGSFNVFSMTGGLRINMSPSDVTPYAAFGGGYYRVSLSDMTVATPVGAMTFPGVSENAFGMNFGGGIQGAMSPSAYWFGEVRYHMAFTSGDETTYIPVIGGVRFTW